MRSERIEDMLDRCLERIAAGEDMTACLRDEPEHADVLAPLLHAAVALRRWGSLCRTEEPPDLVLLDPPRAGAADAVSFIAAVKPARVSYVSCDPTTLARDLRSLVDSGYELERVTAVDLFPQTYHIETVASLRRLKSEN